jgi:hypothetical protein
MVMDNYTVYKYESPAVSRIGNYINDILMHMCEKYMIDRNRKKFINTEKKKNHYDLLSPPQQPPLSFCFGFVGGNDP